MKKIISVILFVSLPFWANAQMAVYDNFSCMQDLTLFLQEMEETIGQSLELSDQTSIAYESLELSQQAAERLKKVSDYVKESRDVLEMTRSGVRISQKMVDYKDRIMQLSNISDEEKYWILDMAMDIAEKAAERATEGLKITEQGASDGQFTDYERLQLIKNMKEQLLSLENDLDDLYSRAASYSNYTGVISSFRNFALDVSTFTD